jgi:hypothetical protein
MKSQMHLTLFAFATVAIPHSVLAERKPVVARKPNMLRTYRFTAKIIYNTGVTPMKVGTRLTGEFTYGLAAHNVSTLKRIGRYRSRRNKLSIRYGKLVFRCQDVVTVSVGISTPNRFEAFSISGGKLNVPKGWRSHLDSFSGMDKSYITFYLQNSPARALLVDGTRIPSHLDAWKRFQTRTLVLDFQDGVDFPGGRVDKRASVYAKIETLQPAKPQ